MKAVFDTTWPVIEKIVVAFAKLANWVITNKPVLIGLTTAFVALKTAMAISSAVKAFQASMGTIRTAWLVTKGVISAPISLPAIGVAAALASLAMVYASIQSIRGAIKDVNSAAKATNDANSGISSSQKKAFDMINSKDPKKKAAGRKLLADLSRAASGYASGGYTGQGGTNEVAGIVHKGEYVIPKKQVDQTTGQPKLGGTVNITIQAGAFMGSQQEARKYAKMIMEAWGDLQSSGRVTA